MLYLQDPLHRLSASSCTGSNETSGWQLIGLHNIHFYLQLMRTMRAHIVAARGLDSTMRSARCSTPATATANRPPLRPPRGAGPEPGAAATK